jgi:hypothetical protein
MNKGLYGKLYIPSYIFEYYGHQNTSNLSSFVSMASHYIPRQKQITQSIKHFNNNVGSIIILKYGLWCSFCNTSTIQYIMAMQNPLMKSIHMMPSYKSIHIKMWSHHINLFFWIPFTSYSFFFCSMANNSYLRSFDKITMESPLMCSHPTWGNLQSCKFAWVVIVLIFFELCIYSSSLKSKYVVYIVTSSNSKFGTMNLEACNIFVN